MHRINRLTLAAVSAAACFLVRSAAAQAPSEDRLQQACLTLQRAPLEPSELQILLDTSRPADGDPALRSRAMAACALTFLMRGNTNSFERAVQLQREAFPADRSLIGVNRDDYLVACDGCAGTGWTRTLCPSCMGSGKCAACAGSGRRKPDGDRESPCPACARSGACAMCAGQKKLDTACPTCKGSRLVFKLSERVRLNYTALLTNIVALCQENKAFTQQAQRALDEGDAAARIRSLQDVAQRFAHRTDLAPVQARLAKEIAQRDAQLAAQRKREEQEREQREVDALLNLRESGDTAGAVAALRVYLAGHPGSSTHRSELQALLDGLVVQQTRRANVLKIAYGTLALLGAALLFQFVRTLWLNRRRAARSTVRDIDKSQFSDPLTLTALESQERGKSQTADPRPGE